MTVSEALRVLGDCDWLKITANHVSASKPKSQAEMSMMVREDLAKPNALYRANVQTRRKKGESFEDLLVRVASMVEAGHVPDVRNRAPVLSSTDRCACGARGIDLVWNKELEQRLCRRCESMWLSAEKNNDMPSAGGGNVQ